MSLATCALGMTPSVNWSQQYTLPMVQRPMAAGSRAANFLWLRISVETRAKVERRRVPSLIGPSKRHVVRAGLVRSDRRRDFGEPHVDGIPGERDLAPALTLAELGEDQLAVALVGVGLVQQDDDIGVGLEVTRLLQVVQRRRQPLAAPLHLQARERRQRQNRAAGAHGEVLQPGADRRDLEAPV